MINKQQKLDGSIDRDEFVKTLQSSYDNEEDDFINGFELAFDVDMSSIDSVKQYDVGYSFIINKKASVMVKKINEEEYIMFIMDNWVDYRLKSDTKKIQVENSNVVFNIYTVLPVKISPNKFELMIDV